MRGYNLTRPGVGHFFPVLNKKKIYFLLLSRSRPAPQKAPITTTGNIPDLGVVVGTTVDRTVVVAVVPVAGAAEDIVPTGAVLVAVRILTCTVPIGGTTFTI